MARCCVANAINRIDGDVDGCIKTNGEIGSGDIIIDRGGNSDDRKLMLLPEKIGGGE